MKDRAAAQTELRRLSDAIRDCRDCGLCEGRTQVVFGAGDPAADLLFVGEGPGFNEDKQGEPFVGHAGRLLDELLEEIGLSRDDVYIANVVKCRPPNNRDPLPDEIKACTPKLMEQVRAIRPSVICTLGRFAARVIAETEASMGVIRGKAKEQEVAGLPLIVFPVYHPAAALYTPANKDVLKEDFRRLHVLLERGRDALRDRGAETSLRPSGEFGALASGAPGGSPSRLGGTAGIVKTEALSDPEQSKKPEQLGLW